MRPLSLELIAISAVVTPLGLDEKVTPDQQFHPAAMTYLPGIGPIPEDRNGKTPLSHASENGHTTVIELLLARSDVQADTADEGGRTPLLWAARSVVKQRLRRSSSGGTRSTGENRSRALRVATIILIVAEAMAHLCSILYGDYVESLAGTRSRKRRPVEERTQRPC